MTVSHKHREDTLPGNRRGIFFQSLIIQKITEKKLLLEDSKSSYVTSAFNRQRLYQFKSLHI